jgi:RNA polymerase sigma-70 factor (ECF subfamily)
MGVREEIPAGAVDPFARLYAEQFRFVWSLAARLGVPPAQREDVAQEVWLTVHRRMQTLRPDASARGWVAAITRKVASRHHRTHYRAERKIAALAEVASDRRAAIGERDSFAIVDEALARMEPTQREVFLLAHVEELSGPEIAEAVDAPLNTVYSRLRLARARLAEFLADVEREEAELVEALRRRDAPPPGAASRVWMLVVAGFGRAAAPVVGVALGTKLAIVGTTAVTTVLLVVGIGAAASDPEPKAATAAPMAPIEPEIGRNRATVSSSMAALGTHSRVVQPLAKPTLREPPVRGTTKAVPVADGPAAPPDTLASETLLVGRARRALADGDAANALALLDEHARTYPSGQMTGEAQALRVRSLCAAGRTDEATRLAASLAAAHPSDPSAAGVRDACAPPPAP